MKTSWFKLACITSLAACALAACSADDLGNDDIDQSESDASLSSEAELGTTEQGVMSCSNPDGTNSAMAALAVAVAQDLGRWQAAKDFVVSGGFLALSSGS